MLPLARCLIFVLINLGLWLASPTTNATSIILTCPQSNVINTQLTQSWQKSGMWWYFSQAFYQMYPFNPDLGSGMAMDGIRGLNHMMPQFLNPHLTGGAISKHGDEGETLIACTYTIHNPEMCDDNCLAPNLPNTTQLKVDINVPESSCHKINEVTMIC